MCMANSCVLMRKSAAIFTFNSFLFPAVNAILDFTDVKVTFTFMCYGTFYQAVWTEGSERGHNNNNCGELSIKSIYY